MQIALIGNPNVGKSLIFSHLTGIGVEVSNFPGTTVDLKCGAVCHQREKIEITDLPGIYSLDGESSEEALVREVVSSRQYDVYIVVLDAGRLERNLYLLLQVLEYGVPVVVVLNMIDEAELHGFEIRTDELAQALGVPVIATSAVLGRNIEQIMPAVLTDASPGTITVMYDRHIEAAVRSMGRLTGTDRPESLLALQGITDDSSQYEMASMIAKEIEDEHRMSVRQLIAANRHHAAASIAKRVITRHVRPLGIDFDRYLTRVFPGLPIMIIVLLTLLLTVFFVGSFLEEIVVSLFDQFIIMPIKAGITNPLLLEILISLAIAIQAGIGIAFPFVLTFYLLISVIEDTGYLARIAFLSDRIMHRFGLHGQAIIPLVLGFGCNVPAIMGIRQLTTRRERIIASYLITMVPCSARTVIIAGIVAAFVGVGWALSIYMIVVCIIVITGVFLARIAPGTQLGMVLEVPPLRVPQITQVFTKSWLHIKEFLLIAMPLLMVSSVFLGLLSFFGVLVAFENVVAPVMDTFLGLPAFSSTALLFGILRKEMAFETLVVLAGTADLSSVMTKVQLYIFALVSTLFVPCISTIAVISRELGWRTAGLISLYTLGTGFLCGALVHFLSSFLM